MKKLTILLTGLLLTNLFLPPYSIGQDYLQGKWHAYCVVEKKDGATIVFSELCQVDASKDSNEFHFPFFEMLIEDGSISIIEDERISKTDYNYDNEQGTLVFTFQEKEYTLKILSVMRKTPRSFILRDGNSIILLEEQLQEDEQQSRELELRRREEARQRRQLAEQQQREQLEAERQRQQLAEQQQREQMEAERQQQREQMEAERQRQQLAEQQRREQMEAERQRQREQQEAERQRQLAEQRRREELARRQAAERYSADQTSQGTFTDSRDGQSYKWVTIGDQIWMTENMNYDAGRGSWCYRNRKNLCRTYGRLYNFETALRACPPGWRLPSEADWSQLTVNVLHNMNTKLKANRGWHDGGNGTDDYGFSALPGGNRSRLGIFGNLGKLGSWWSSSTAIDTRHSLIWEFFYSHDYVGRNSGNRSQGHSVRCVRNID